ncbi:hypothetical protein ACPOL_0809 [Acidisarcina polymorpha]|uniref:Uncharacterized protein n=1 Tax=Acidisarcina polymorpha TaxID=2211140 RepID=A0A2Z5FTN0_9BACT|nr:hypothetical protein ACPOL_0809 [Acidisarcina polymorpha]
MFHERLNITKVNRYLGMLFEWTELMILQSPQRPLLRV